MLRSIPRPSHLGLRRTAACLVTAAACTLSGVAVAQTGTVAAKPAVQADVMAGLKFVRLTTNQGQIHLLLDEMAAPLSVANFLKYVDDDHYDGTVFHRVMQDFMIQGGGFAPEGDQLVQKQTRDGVLNEYKNGLSNMDLTVAMARLGRQPHSGTAQFFINVKDNPFLDQPRDGAGYAVFGIVVDGVETVQKIRQTPVGMGQLGGRSAENVPDSPMVITSAERMKTSDLSETAKTAAAKWVETNDEKRKKAAALQAKYDAGVAALAADGTTHASGLRTLVTEDGEGEIMPLGSRATVQYTGWMAPGWLFDSSVGQPTGDTYTAVIQAGGLIDGWIEGIPMMKKGETRWLEIPPSLAYGPSGRAPIIPPNATLIFEVKLVDFTPPGG